MIEFYFPIKMKQHQSHSSKNLTVLRKMTSTLGLTSTSEILSIMQDENFHINKARRQGKHNEVHPF